MGASVIEKHFILNKKLNSLDKTFSIDIKQLKELKEITSKIYSSLGKPIIGPKKNEISSLKFRRSIFAIKDIKKGEKFSKNNICCYRPKIGVGSENFSKLIGSKSSRNYKKNSAISELI